MVFPAKLSISMRVSFVCYPAILVETGRAKTRGDALGTLLSNGLRRGARRKHVPGRREHPTHGLEHTEKQRISRSPQFFRNRDCRRIGCGFGFREPPDPTAQAAVSPL